MFERFKTRSHELERLDTGDYTPAEYARWQHEMWYIHRFFGEAKALRSTLLSDLANSGRESVSVLDVGAGSGELLKIVRDEVKLKAVHLVGVELNQQAAKSIKLNGLDSVRCNALRLPFADNAFDYVMCSLFLHHLSDMDAETLLREMGRVAKRRIFAIDLNREPLPYYLYKIFGRIVLQRFTVEDGSLSILRSFKPHELVELAQRAGLSEITVTRSRMNRLVLEGRKADER